MALANVGNAAPAHAQDGASKQDGWFAGERGIAGKVSFGPSFHRLHDIGVVSGDLELAAGAQTRSGGWYGTVGGRLGGTDGGLAMGQLGIGASWEAPIVPRWHLGLALDGTAVWFDRVSAPGSIDDAGLGGRVFTTYDVLHGGSGGVFVGAELGTDVYFGNATVLLYGGGLRVGARMF